LNSEVAKIVCTLHKDQAYSFNYLCSGLYSFVRVTDGAQTTDAKIQKQIRTI